MEMSIRMTRRCQVGFVAGRFRMLVPRISMSIDAGSY